MEHAIESLWCFQQAKRKDEINLPLADSQCKWMWPPHGTIKINTDTAIFEKENAIGLGMIMKDNSRVVIATQMWRKDDIRDVVRVELQARWKG